MTALDTAGIIDTDAKEEHFQFTQNETETREPLNQPATSNSQETTYDVVVKDVNDDKLDANLDEEN